MMPEDTQGHNLFLLGNTLLLQYLWGWTLKLRLSLKRLKERDKKASFPPDRPSQMWLRINHLSDLPFLPAGMYHYALGYL